MLRALLFTVVYLGYRPRIALETSDSGYPRLAKIVELIGESRYAIHDLSRLQATAIGEYYRLNMPFELGLDFGHKSFHPDGDNKCILVLEKEPFRYQRALSDLSGCDIKQHNGNAPDLIRVVRDWFRETVNLKEAPGPTLIWNRFNDFMYVLHLDCLRKGFSESDFGRLSFAEFIDSAMQWIKTNRAVATDKRL